MDGYIVIETDLDTKSFDAQIDYVKSQLEDIEDKLKKADMGFEVGDTQKLEAQYEKLVDKLQKLVQKKNEFNNKDLKVPDIKGSLNSIGNATENVIKKVMKWGLALFSVRSAYNFIRSSMSLLAQDNEQMGANIEYIRWALANTLKPIIETIINLAYTLLQYINYIANAWFGVNLFANATADAFKRTKDNVKGTNSEAKKLQKTLAGFDEMNILQENGSTSRGGGGGGIALPETDLSQMLPQEEIPGWIKWIADNGDLLKTIIADIGFAFAGWKIFNLISDMKLLGGEFTGLQKLLIGLGIGKILQGIWDIISNWGKDVSGVIGGVGETIEGLGLMLVGINPKAWWAWAILGVGFLLDLMSHLFDTRTDTEKLKEAQDKLNEATQKYIDAQKNELNAFKNAKKAREDLVAIGKEQGKTEDEIRQRGKNLYDLIQNEGIGAYERLNDADKKIYEAYLNEIDANKRLQKTSEETINARKDEVEASLNEMFYLAKTSGSWDAYGKAIVEAYKQGTLSSEEAAKRIQSALFSMDNDARKTFVENLPNDIDKTTIAYDNLGRGIFWTNNKLKEEFDKMATYADKPKKSLDNLLGVFGKLRDAISKVNGKINISTNYSTGGVAYAKGGIVTRLATGGIVNRPGRGVPIASSYMGEAGREGILPLTDAQAMETLGQAIGRYISINATIPISVGNRQIAREIRKIEAEDDFAYNGG